jgi:Na+-driven multidrug efflux pump
VSERRDFVLTAPIGRAIWSLTWPIAISSQLSILTVSILLFWLGRLAGETGLVVESLFRPLGLLFGWLFASTAVGASVLVSRSVGASDGRGLSITAGTLTLSLALWGVVAAVALPMSPQLAGVLAGGLPIERPMLGFVIGWFAVTLPALTLAQVLLDVASATGATRFNLVRVLVDLACMAALVPALMQLGLGVAGGPVAEGIAALGLNVVLWLAVVRRRGALGLGELGAGAWRIRWPLWRELLAIGLPVQAGRIAMFAAQLILVQRVAQDGPARVAGYGVATALFLFGVTATLALAEGGGILVGQSLGAGDADRARRGVRAMLLAGWTVMGVFVVATAFSRPIIGLFTDKPAVADAAAHALSILRWGGFGVATWQILLAAFAAHRATVRAGMLIISGEAVGLVVALALPGARLDAVCIAFVAANALKAVLLLGLLATGTIARARAELATAGTDPSEGAGATPTAQGAPAAPTTTAGTDAG